MAERFGRADFVKGTGIGTLAASTVMAATLEDYDVTVVTMGDIIETFMYIDITGIAATATSGDIMGAAGVCHLGQVSTEVTGNIFYGEVLVAEAPAGGTNADGDIDLYSATEATGAYDGAIGDLTETALMAAGGALTVGSAHPFTAIPTDNSYLYLTAGAGSKDGTYTAGKLCIHLLGRSVAL